MTDFFPILHLPLIVLNDVLKQLDPIELYTFAVSSQRTKELSKSVRKRTSHLEIHLKDDSRLVLKFHDELVNDSWTFMTKHISQIGWGKRRNERSVTLFSEDSAKELERLLDVLLEVFESSKRMVVKYSRKKDVELIVDWMNRKNIDIEEFELSIYPEELFKYVITRLRKPIKKLTTTGCIMCSKVYLEIPLTLKIEYLNAESGGEWLSLDHLLSMDCKEIDMRNDFISNQEVNLFLKSWKEGKTNSRLERIGMKYGYEKVVDWNIILKGLKPKIRDLRTTKRKYVMPGRIGKDFVIWRHGGIDIQRDDGTIGMIYRNRLFREVSRQGLEFRRSGDRGGHYH